MRSRLPDTLAPGSAVTGRAGEELLSRYRLERPLGSGGQGSVWRAEDRVGGTAVAVKVGVGVAEAEARHLRRLDVPGVVRYFDHGVQDGRSVLVMELVEGVPFPGTRGPLSWERLEPLAVALLEAVARLHDAGLRHGDLKPGNVLVTRRGQPVLVDLGVASPEYGDEADDGFVGTPLYAAPELLAREGASPAADVYAVGLMVVEGLTGRVPHAGTWRQLVARRVAGAPLNEELPLPAPARRVLDALLAPAPAERPTAREAADELGAGLRSGTVSAIRRVLAEAPPETARLTGLFAGPEKVLRLVSGPAAILEERAGRDVERAAAELAAWTRAGLAEPDGDQLRVSPGGLAWLRRSRARVRSAGLAGVDGVEAALEEASRLEHAGRVHDARAVIEPWSPSQVPPALAERLARTIARLGLLDGTARALAEARAALQRLSGDTRPLVGLLDAAAGSVAGRHAEAVRLAGEEGRFGHDDLDGWWEAIQLRGALAAGRPDPDELLAHFARTRDGGPLLAARRASLAGLVRYRQGRFEEAAALHRSAGDPSLPVPRRLGALLNEAGALTDAFRLARATRAAEEARALAAAHGLPHYEAQALRHLRGIAYRQGEDGPVDDELVEAVRLLDDPPVYASVLLGELAREWRSRSSGASRLAVLCVDAAEQAALPGVALLAGAVLVLLGQRPLDEGLRGRLQRCPLPRVRLQAAWLAGDLAVRDAALADLDPLVRAHAGTRLELASLDECRVHL